MFFAFALLTLAGALSLLLQRNLILAGLSMVLCFLGLSGLFLLLSNPVAAALQIIVYSGAIVVLVLFVIMLLNAHQEEPVHHKRPLQRWLGAGTALALGAAALFALVKSTAIARFPEYNLAKGPMTLQQMGHSIFRDHVAGFEVAGLLLLAAMVAAVTLVKRDL